MENEGGGNGDSTHLSAPKLQTFFSSPATWAPVVEEKRKGREIGDGVEEGRLKE